MTVGRIMSFVTKLLTLFYREKGGDLATKETIEATGSCYIEMLFTKNVPHILEKIFLSMDFDSFNECLRVNNAWNELLNSESFQKKARSVFQKEIPEYECKLWIASKDGRAGEVRRLLSNCMLDVNHAKREWEKDATTSLSIAAKYGRRAVTKLLLDRGADPNKATRRGWTPLHMAARSGHIGVVKILIERGAVVKIADVNGETPLHSAARKGDMKIFHLLVERGADISKEDNMGRDPLYHCGMALLGTVYD